MKKIKDVQDFLRQCSSLLEKGGGKQAGKTLNKFVESLKPHEDKTLAAFQKFLAQAQVLGKRQSGNGSATTNKGPDEAKIRRAHSTVQQLYDTALEASFDPFEVRKTVNNLKNELSADELVEVARQFEITRSLKNKQAYADAIASRIIGRREAFDRADV